MNCEEVRADDVAERYLTHRLTDADREAFEQHYFECAQCFEALQVTEAVREELSRAEAAGLVDVVVSPTRARRWFAAAAGLILAISVGMWLITQRQRTLTPGAVEERETPRPAIASTSPDAGDALDQLARVDPPPYLTLTVRSGDENLFEAAMERYARGDYAGAAEGLRALASADVRVSFYLGASELMIGRPDAAIDALDRVVASGHAAYAESAHLLLAKAWLARRRVPEARRELTTCAALGGAHADEARKLLERLDAIAPS